jgi:hypothetical protein
MNMTAAMTHHLWFDMLNKLIVVRSTMKPKEKSSEERSKE